MANPRNLKRIDESHAEPDEANAPRDPVPGVLERDGNLRHSGWDGFGGRKGEVNSRNPHKQGNGSTVEPMHPGTNGG